MAAEGQRELFLDPDADLHRFIAADMIQGSARASPTKQSIVAGFPNYWTQIDIEQTIEYVIRR